MFPPDVFTDEQLADGFVVFPCLGILYMFVALALICDDYFVPSLDVLTETLGLAPDVAGATFMAAGGSAPELFTSIIGVFLTKSDVGIGTIVGSAVFNVLFVIAACAFASATALKLTPWPLMRDTFFYSIALGLLVYFFTDDEIKWWESLILFLWYIAYVSFMKFNGVAEERVSGLLFLLHFDKAHCRLLFTTKKLCISHSLLQHQHYLMNDWDYLLPHRLAGGRGGYGAPRGDQGAPGGSREGAPGSNV